MPSPNWTRKLTWPSHRDPYTGGPPEDWLVYRDGVHVGRLYAGAGPNGKHWLWVRQNGPRASGIAESYEEAREALMGAIEREGKR
jgi:hypothetical protein